MKRIAWTLLVAAALVLTASGARVMPTGDQSVGHEKTFAPCAKACAECTNSCASCYQHCLDLVSAGQSDHKNGPGLVQRLRGDVLDGGQTDIASKSSFGHPLQRVRQGVR
jgi:hypothetical protein